MTISDNQSTTNKSDRFSRLREVLSGSPKTRGLQRLQKQMQTSRPRNAMLAILLHACARLERGEPLSDVETKMLDSVREYNSDEDLKEFGRIYQELTSERREALFPGRLATRSVSQSYSQTEFNEDLNTVISELMSQPNVRTINVDELPPDTPLDPDDKAFRQAVGDYGHGIVMYTSSKEKNQLASTEPKSYAIRLDRFYCVDNSDEWSSDELYFSVGGASDLSNKHTYTSEEIGDVDPDETHRFPSNSYAFRGKYQTHISIDVEIWEKDQGSSWGAVASAVNDVADYCAEVAKGLAEDDETQKAAGLAALVAIVGWILGGIFGMMEDDFTCQRTITFDAGTLQKYAGKEDWWRFYNSEDDGAAHLQLTLEFQAIPTLYSSDINAAVNWGNGKAYFFKGNQYIRYDISDDEADAGYPVSITTYFSGLDAFASGIDAAVIWNNKKAYFFKGDKYIRYDIASDRADAGYPMSIGGGYWDGLEPFASGIDAAVNWGDGVAYFFKGSQYIRYGIGSDEADGGPKSIRSGFPGLEPFADGIDTVINWGNGKAYFFKGDKYIRYDIASDRADAGYPMLITSF